MEMEVLKKQIIELNIDTDIEEDQTLAKITSPLNLRQMKRRYQIDKMKKVMTEDKRFDRYNKNILRSCSCLICQIYMWMFIFLALYWIIINF